jgi:hypothetical protein
MAEDNEVSSPKITSKCRYSYWPCSMPDFSLFSVQARAKITLMHYWEVIADNLSKAGWSWG